MNRSLLFVVLGSAIMATFVVVGVDWSDAGDEGKQQLASEVILWIAAVGSLAAIRGIGDLSGWIEDRFSEFNRLQGSKPRG